MKDTEFAAHFNELQTRIAAEDSRKLTLPAKAEEYKAELPADFKPPEGVKFEFKADDPLIAQAKSMAHEMGIDQANFSKLLGLYAGAQVASQTQITAARNAEIAKLGTTGPARIDAVTRWAKATLGEAEGNQFASRLFTASDIAIAEKLISRMTNQGAGSFRANGRDTPQDQGKVSEADYNKMSAADRLAYARKFPQAGMQRKAS